MRFLNRMLITPVLTVLPFSNNQAEINSFAANLLKWVLPENSIGKILFPANKSIAFANPDLLRYSLYFLAILAIIASFTCIFLSIKKYADNKKLNKRKSLEDILNVSEERFRVIFELSPAGLILIDEKGKIIEVNPAFCETLGYTREELISKNIRLFAAPGNMDEIERNIQKILKGNTLKHEVKNIRKDGSACDVALFETMIQLSDGKPGILSVSNDITERKKVFQELLLSKEKAEESDKLKSTFLTNMSHELRTPLNAIIGFSSFMSENGKDEETIAYSKIIFESGQHLLKLVEDILDSSLIEIGQMKIKHENTELLSLLNEVKNIIIGERLRDNKLHIEIILSTGQESKEKIILTDSRKLKQVLINLLKNALKYTDEGYIEFGFTEITEDGKRFLKFFVRDTGIGIEEKFHDVIFNLFRQVDETYTRKQGGTGLGLSIVKSIVEMLGGRIWLESERGKGSVFSFTIPDTSEDSGADRRSETGLSVHENYNSGKTILVVEDEITNFEFLQLILARMKIGVLWAKTGKEAIKMCDENPSISMVLMDIKLPEMNGFEATRLIKSKHPSIPVIAQTAYAMASDRDEAIEAGCDGYLSKPIEINNLKELIARFIR